MISRRSSGSRRADSAVEPTRSQNITVTWRRSAASWEVCRKRRIGCGYRVAQRGDGIEQLAAMPDGADAKLFQVLRRQTRQDRVVDRIVAERRLILFETKAPQPTSKFHRDVSTSTWRAMIVQAHLPVQVTHQRRAQPHRKRTFTRMRGRKRASRDEWFARFNLNARLSSKNQHFVALTR